MPPICRPPDDRDKGQSADREEVDPQNNIRELAAVYPDFVASCDERALALLRETERFRFPAGTVMFREQDPCQNFIWLLKGSVRIYKHSADGREVTLYRVEAGDLCVLSLNALLGKRAYPAEAVAETGIAGLILKGHVLLQGIRESESFRTYVMKTLTERLHEMMVLVSDIAFHRLDLRLACVLGQRFERSGGESLNVTHADLARELGTTREVVSRILKEFERQQCVSLSRGRIHLVSQDGLEWFIRGE